MKNRREIILTGFGGQGLGLGGQLLAEAAIIDNDFNVTHNQSYGAQARGGASQSSVIISSEEIIFPMVDQADILMALSPEGYSISEKQVNPKEGFIIYDSSLAINVKGRVKEWGCPFQREIEKLEHPKGITLIALGTVIEIVKFISPDS
ncbi:MAG: 2-oxoacid:acceptor oxidoreductase family protein, partial [Candidatus Contubernalis sp.]|nr:2-oxoacid:acceptor oxidoreductase family protein [Candidatus Contubernalis sp.]